MLTKPGTMLHHLRYKSKNGNEHHKNDTNMTGIIVVKICALVMKLQIVCYAGKVYLNIQIYIIVKGYLEVLV